MSSAIAQVDTAGCSRHKQSINVKNEEPYARFCGSQRYSASKKNFEKLDKYVGRKATEREFRELLANFFFKRVMALIENYPVGDRVR